MSKIEWNFDKPLQLCDNESQKANYHLQLYYRLGVNRSLQKVSELEDCQVSLRMLEFYSVDYDWQARIKRQY